MSTPTCISPIIRLIIAATICAAAGAAQAQQRGSVSRGLKFARQMCSECHLVVKEAGRSTNRDAPTFAAIARTKGLTSAALRSALRTSHPTMPNIVINGDEIDDIVAYILSLKEKD